MDRIKGIYRHLDSYIKDGLSLFTTSSFQTHSVALLHILRGYTDHIPVYFIHTGYHFPETIAYKDQIAELLELQVYDLHSSTPKSMQRDHGGRLLFTSDPDYCCYLNKTQPLEAVLRHHDVWINGVRRDQNSFRNALKTEEAAPFDCLRYHPILDWSIQEVYAYLKKHEIPKHPLDEKGYLSIGCEPCTRKRHAEIDEREARWYGLNKVECGLQTDLIQPS